MLLQEKSCPCILGGGPGGSVFRGGRLREAVGGRRGVVSHHGAPGGGSGAENAAFSTV